jgi:uncharacterized protein (TIGR03437 family)
MLPTSRWMIAAIWFALSAGAWGQTFGQVVALGGISADLALDEPRKLLYVANFTANRIDVITTDDGVLQRSINVSSQPSSLALSPDGQYLVVAHYGNFAAPNTPRNALTVIQLETRAKQTFSLPDPPYGVAFGIDGQALVVTSTQFILFDPVLGTMQVLDTIAGVTAKTLPQPPDSFPTQIVGASVQASGDGSIIYGVTDTILFSYQVGSYSVQSGGYVASPPLGPRAASVSKDGSYWIAGWAMFDRKSMLSQFPNPLGLLNVGSTAIDSDRGIIYAQIPEGVPTTTTSSDGTTTTTSDSGTGTALPPPFLMVTDADNLTVRAKLKLSENLSGKGIVSSDGSTMYALSESGVTILPVGSLSQSPRVEPVEDDLVFRSNFCSPGVLKQNLTIVDPSGGNTEFSISTTQSGVTISPSSGITPATVEVSIDASAFQNQRGTVVAYLDINSPTAVNYPKQVRVLINLQDPDQRGVTQAVPGKLVDILSDPFRNRFFVLRQDTNEVRVYDGANYQELARLRTGNTPTSMALTFDRKYLLVGNDNSQIANVYDLETLAQMEPIRFPFGHYPRWLAASANAILAATRVAGPIHVIDRVDFNSRTATQLPTLGVYENNIDINTALVAAANGNSILAAEADGNLLLYNANADSFTISRKSSTKLSGAVAASSFDQYAIGDTLYNASLVPVKQLGGGVGQSSGFVFVDQIGYRTGAQDSSSPGLIQKVALSGSALYPATSMAEAPVLPSTGTAFTRTVALMPDRATFVNLTVSGFTVLSWNYSSSVPSPQISSVVNAADQTKGVAPGGLIIVRGTNLSPVNIATKEVPLPVALGQSCLTVNGMPVPMLMVSPTQINAQLPFQAEGHVTMVLRTPGGVSDNFNVTVLPNAPSVFRQTVSDDYSVPTVVRAANNQVVTPANPIRDNDTLYIYLTGMGKTNPEIPAGQPSPQDAPVVLTDPTVDIAGRALPVQFAGLVSGEIGVYQIKVTVPWYVPTGLEMPLRISQGGYTTTVVVRVID